MIETSHHLELQWICVYLLTAMFASSICTFSTMLKCICQFHCLSMVLCLKFEPHRMNHWQQWLQHIKNHHQIYIYTNLSMKMRNYHIFTSNEEECAEMDADQRWRWRKQQRRYQIASNQCKYLLWLHITKQIVRWHSCSDHRTSTSMCASMLVCKMSYAIMPYWNACHWHQAN